MKCIKSLETKYIRLALIEITNKLTLIELRDLDNVITSSKLCNSRHIKPEKLYSYISEFLREFPDTPATDIKLEHPCTYNTIYKKYNTGDRNIPLAIPLFTGEPVKFIKSALDVKSCTITTWRTYLMELNILTTKVTSKYRPFGTTLHSITKVLDPNRKFIIEYTGNRLAAFANGRVIDKNEGRHFRITEILEIAENGITVSDFEPSIKRIPSRSIKKLEEIVVSNAPDLFYKYIASGIFVYFKSLKLGVPVELARNNKLVIFVKGKNRGLINSRLQKHYSRNNSMRELKNYTRWDIYPDELSRLNKIDL